MNDISKRAAMRKERTQQILDVTQQLVLKEGFGANLMSRIAKECGISRQRLYCYYDNLNAILAELHDLCVKRLAENFSAGAIARAQDGLLSEDASLFYFELNDDVLFLSAYEVYAQKNETIQTEGKQESIPVLCEMIREGQEKGIIRTDFTAEQLSYLVGQLLYAYSFKAMVMRNDSYGGLLLDERVMREVRKMIQSLLRGDV